MKTKRIYICDRCGKEEITPDERPDDWFKIKNIRKTEYKNERFNKQCYRFPWEFYDDYFICNKCGMEYERMLNAAMLEMNKWFKLEGSYKV